MIQPEKAAVRPRVVSPLSGEIVLLDEEISELLDRKHFGRVLIVGPTGSGKTTALRHLAAVLGSGSGVVFLDEPDLVEIAKTPEATLQVIGATCDCPWLADVTYQLAAWIH